jgi:hypothetical protein
MSRRSTNKGALRSPPQFETIGGAMGLVGEAPRLTLQPISLLTIRKHTLTVSNGLRTSFRRFG